MANTVQDILLDANNDLQIDETAGDFDFGFSDNQHVGLIINTYLGDWKQFVNCGLGAEQYLSSPNLPEVLKREVTIQLQADGFTVGEIDIENDGVNLSITPAYLRVAA